MAPQPQLLWKEDFDGSIPFFRNITTYTILPIETMFLLKTFPVEQIVLLGAHPLSRITPEKKVEERYTEEGFRYLIIDTLLVPPQRTTPNSSDEVREQGKPVGSGVLRSLERTIAGASHKHPAQGIDMSSHKDIPFADKTRFDCYAVYSGDGERANWYIRRDAKPDEFNNRGSFLLPCFPGHKDTEHALSFPVRRGVVMSVEYDKIEVPLGDGPIPRHTKTITEGMPVFQPEIQSFDLRTFDPRFTEPLQNYQFYCIVV